MTHPDSAAIKLQQAAMPVVSNRVCQAKHMASPVSRPGESAVTSAMICAGDAGKTKISGCFGDDFIACGIVVGPQNAPGRVIKASVVNELIH